MVTEVFNLKKKNHSAYDWTAFKRVAKEAGATHVQTGQSKTMFYLRTTSSKSVWKKILNTSSHQFEYVPSGSSSNVKWNKIKVKL